MKIYPSLLLSLLTVEGASAFRPLQAVAPSIRSSTGNVVSRNFVLWTRPSHGSNSVRRHAKPHQGSVVDSYRTVSVNCAKCGHRLFRYKKKNGTKTNLVKCYIERIVEDSAGLFAKQETTNMALDECLWECPNCETRFARYSLIHGRPALKIIGGKVRMANK